MSRATLYTHVRIGVVYGLAVAAVAVAASTVTAQIPGAPTPSAAGSQRSAPSVLLRVIPGPSLSAPDVARLSTILARADTMASQDRVREAARLYWFVVAEQRAAAEYPAETFRKIALMYFLVDEEDMAAGVFMELAASAAEFGDPTTRLRSLFDAALMYQRLGRTDKVAECVRGIWPLLRSAAIPSSVREDIRVRMRAPVDSLTSER